MDANIKNLNLISIIIPVHNGASTLGKTLDSLLEQDFHLGELIIIDDASADDSVQVVEKYLNARAINYKFLKNSHQLGLAKTYNKAVKESKGEIIATVHQDVVLKKKALEKLIAPFSNPEVLATSHVVDHPMETWNKYNFWQKCFFARLAGKKFSGIDGKFDGFRKEALEKVGYFDEVHFRTAGEDGDMVAKLEKIGKIFQTDAEIVHLHKIDPDFSWKDIIYKQKQYSEAQGALLRMMRIIGPVAFFKSFFREFLIIGLFFPYIRYIAIILIFLYSFWYTKIVYLKEFRDVRVIILPLFNVALLFVSSFYCLKGFIFKKQKN